MMVNVFNKSELVGKTTDDVHITARHIHTDRKTSNLNGIELLKGRTDGLGYFFNCHNRLINHQLPEKKNGASQPRLSKL